MSERTVSLNEFAATRGRVNGETYETATDWVRSIEVILSMQKRTWPNGG